MKESSDLLVDFSERLFNFSCQHRRPETASPATAIPSFQQSLSSAMAVTSSPLLRLPPELRLQIFENVFEGAVFDITADTGVLTHHYYIKDASPATQAPGLLLASKQLHSEAIGVYYQTATFRAQPANFRHIIDGPAMQILALWLSRLAPVNRESLSDVRCDVAGVASWRGMAPASSAVRLSYVKLCEAWPEHMESLLVRRYGIRMSRGVFKCSLL